MGRGWVATVALATSIVGAGTAQAAGLPEVRSGARPGPDALYAPAPDAPQLQNTGPWTARPILISGASAYRDGEFLHQDWLTDDHGALGVKDPTDPFGVEAFLFSPKTGTATYPTDPVYANNAADLVELRVKPLADATAFRVTLNTLKDPERTAFTIALGGAADGEARAWPHEAGVTSPAELFLTVHGTTAELVDAASGTVRPGATASVDLERRQVDVRVPRSAWDPGRAVVRMAAGVGLWDRAAGTYLAVAPGPASATSAGGGGSPSGARLFNVAFRGEDVPDVGGTGVGVTIADAAVGGGLDGSWWRERTQANILRDGDLRSAFAQVDFGKLADRVTDESAVPQDGPMDRILASRFAFGQGVDYAKACGGISAAFPCDGAWLGQLQPYALYVPKKPRPAQGYGLTLLLHSLSANYNQYLGSKNQAQLGERGAGSLVVTPQGRGPDGFYTDIAEADTFEVWADVARHYPVDADWVAISGYSMGGFGTFRLASRWPDLFARGFSVVGRGSPDTSLASLRNVPLLSWAAAADELVNIQSTEATFREMDRLDLPVTHDLFPAADHLTIATNDEYGKGAAFLGEHRVDRDPPHVTYVVDPSGDSARAGAVADHAYWLSGLRVRDGAPRGTIDVRSEAFGVGDPQPGAVVQRSGAVEGGSRGPLPFAEREQAFAPAPATPKADKLVVRATGVRQAVVDTRRARVSCAPQLDVVSDGPLDLQLTCPPVPRPKACSKTLRLKVPQVRGRRVVEVRVSRNGKLVKRATARRLRVVHVQRPRSGAFRLRITARTNGTKRRTVTVVRRYRGC